MKEQFLVIVLSVFTCLLVSGSQKLFAFTDKLDLQQADFSNPQFNDCYDGDTCSFTFPQMPIEVCFDKVTCNIPSDFRNTFNIRFKSVDTPEIKGQCERERVLAQQAKQFTIQILKQATSIQITDFEKGWFYRKSQGRRLLGRVFVNGQDLSLLLIQQGLGRPYYGRRMSWC